MTATSGTGSEAARMSKEQMRQEKLYQATMCPLPAKIDRKKVKKTE